MYDWKSGRRYNLWCLQVPFEGFNLQKKKKARASEAWDNTQALDGKCHRQYYLLRIIWSGNTGDPNMSTDTHRKHLSSKNDSWKTPLQPQEASPLCQPTFNHSRRHHSGRPAKFFGRHPISLVGFSFEVAAALLFALLLQGKSWDRNMKNINRSPPPPPLLLSRGVGGFSGEEEELGWGWRGAHGAGRRGL